MTGVFDFIEDLSNKKEYILDENNKNNFIPYITNRNFSLFADTFYLSEKMNRISNLDNKILFDYYFYSILKKKRFKKWPKKENNDQINLLAEYYNINKLKAKEILKFFNEEQFKEISDNLKKE